jgi:hypothetical protein
VSDFVDALMELPALDRKRIMAGLTQPERLLLKQQIEYRANNRWAKYLGKPIEFVEEGLGEGTWSLQREVIRSCVENKRTAVPTTHGIGKTHIAARAAAYFIAVHPPGTAFVLTTSMDFNKVRNLLWPHIRSLHRQHKLPGRTTETGWVLGEHKLAQGVKPPDQAEAGISGYHSYHMLIIVDEAGGIKTAFGKSLEALMTGLDVHILVMGNPPVHGDTTWFENICNSKLWNVIKIPYTATPNFTGEETAVCTACPIEAQEDGHRVAAHLTDKEWVEDLRYEFGEDSAWFKARALAEFVHDTSSKVLPMDWLDAAQNTPDAGPGIISLGCDIAADGGDEFVIAKKDGWTCKVVHISAGADNANSVMVAAKILQHIREAEEEHRQRGITEPVRVKIDAIGIGWGVAGTLQGWEAEGKFNAHIVPVKVSENARDDQKYHRQRDEMWWSFRNLIEPNNPDAGLLRLEVGNRELAQLNSPLYSADSQSRILVESKKDMRDRGIRSPDRAEAILLAFYDPPNDQENTFSMVMFGQSNKFSQ